MKNVYLVRHGSLPEEYDSLYVGSMDIPLSAKGEAEAVAVGNYLQALQYEEVYASPMLRVQQTLKLSGEHPAQTVSELREIDFGEWEGKSFSDISRDWPLEVTEWFEEAEGFTFPGGEKLDDFFARMDTVIDLLESSSAENIVLFTHGGVICSLICRLITGNYKKVLGFEVSRGSVSQVRLFGDGRGVLCGLNHKPEVHEEP
ncbi:histidine phosphatase family protein [Lentisphaerota bacterium ZTH]|nr:histidine phosphatase family protein [Lentisphaerota bacterium]WET07556.1 histidine phosphatase family protein [Lentisphaerota bacterium ZTH]